MSVESDLLAAAGMPTGAVQQQMMAAWTACEGGISNNNPLNVSGSWWPGYQSCIAQCGGSNPIGFYDTLANGISACAQNLQTGRYAGVRSAISSGDLAGFPGAVGGSGWGTNGGCIASNLGVAAPHDAGSASPPTRVNSILGGLSIPSGALFIGGLIAGLLVLDDVLS